LLSPEGQMEQVWEPSKKKWFLEMEKIGEEEPSIFSDFRSVKHLSLF
jgi:hypothetical protein